MENNQLVKQTFDLAAPQEAMKVAAELQRFVNEKKLTANIKGKNYPLVEAWQFAGSQLGLYPLLVETVDQSKDNECKHKATVEIRRVIGDQLLSRGVAVCSNKEATKRTWDEYAILSMAQTRAEGKAYRMLLSWLMKAAGFEATPAEEMDFAKSADFSDVPDEGERQLLRNLVYNSDLSDDEKELAMSHIDSCPDYTRYDKIRIRLEGRQLPIDQISNPNGSDINKHLRKTVKA